MSLLTHSMGHGAPRLLLVVVATFLGPCQTSAQTEWDRTQVVGPDECAECHEVATEVWQATGHFETFTRMPRSKEAREIADRMGIRRIKADSLCQDCHFTTVVEEGKRVAIAGVSCESCHSPSKNWIKVHGEFSGKKEETETEEEARERWLKAEAAGMIRPQHLYRLAQNCFNCHVVPQEQLVNKGGHPAGSEFELVAWSQGEIRHNVWYTEGTENKVASEDRRRLMYVVGVAVELETALRAVGKATLKDTYAVAMAKRAKAAAVRVARLAKALDVPELEAMVDVARQARLRLNNEAELSTAADKIGAAAKKLAANYDGSAFTAVDSVLPSPDEYKGTPSR